MKLKKFLALTSLFIFTTGAVNAMAENAKKIIIVGDSTACEYGYDDNYALPRAGWGMYFNEYVKDDIEIVNLAKSGRSSKSVKSEENYTQMLDSLSEGDYLFIQFGHNDQKKSSEEDLATRYTDPEGDKETEGSFKNSLYEGYVQKAVEKDATPVLLTPISRLKYNEDGTVNDSHGIYDDAVRELASELNVTWLDMTKATEDVYEINGEESSSAFHAIYKDNTKGKDGLDTTHLNHYGANVIASLVALEMERNDLDSLTNGSNYSGYTISRADFVKELVRLAGFEGEGEPFADAPDVKELTAARAVGLTVGTGDNRFSPDSPLTFEDMNRFIERFNTIKNEDVPEVGETGNVQESQAYDMYLKIYTALHTASGNVQSDDEIEKVE